MVIGQAWMYALTHADELGQAMGRHILYVAIALGFSIVIGVPLGTWTSRSRTASMVIINSINTLRVVPSLAILFVMIPYLGLSFASAAVSLTILALPPVLLNTHAAFRTIEGAVRESARGMGMTPRQILWRVEVPLALPIIVAGIRTATVEVISSATLAAFIGGGGLGRFITRGLAMYDAAILLVGAVPIALLALLAEYTLGTLQHAVEPPMSFHPISLFGKEKNNA